MATHSSILAWKIPWIEEPARLWFMGSQSQTVERLSMHRCARTHTHINIKNHIFFFWAPCSGQQYLNIKSKEE